MPTPMQKPDIAKSHKKSLWPRKGAPVARTRRDRWLDFVDRAAARVIVVGGILVVLSVIAIIVFIGAGALPLFKGAKVSTPTAGKLFSDSAPITPVLTLSDETHTRAITLAASGAVSVFDISSAVTKIGESGVKLDNANITVAATDLFQKFIVCGDSSGRIHIHSFEWETRYDSLGQETTPEFSESHTMSVFDSLTSIITLAVAQHEDDISIVAVGDKGVARLATYNADFGRESVTLIPTSLDAGVASVAITHDAQKVSVGYSDGNVGVYDVDSDSATLRESFSADNSSIDAQTFLLGATALVTGSHAGAVSLWLPARPDSQTAPRYTKAADFASHSQAVTRIVASSRDRSFVTSDLSGAWKLHHSTSRRTYHDEKSLGSTTRSLSMTPKSDGILEALDDGRIVFWSIANPHPEVTLATLFSGVWYEGYNAPQYMWQTTGGSDESEPKLSLVPLLFGTIKGALYSLLFSIPIALFAAMYVSQLATPRLRAIVKPTLELMAALPSVVVGFLAALWLAPYAQKHLVAVALMFLSVPVSALTGSLVIERISRHLNARIFEGREFFFALPFVAVGLLAALQLEPILTQAWFGGDVNEWLFTALGIHYDQRNCLVIGFALGFAVIPIIFTVAEDALSSVPRALVSGALALGATRWQATWKIVLRSASPGIFAAVMLGFGRAVGETMIVLMATGNTPIIDWSLFNGMRTMSAAIAVEIPEAAVGGTLYRVLFLTAFLLFVFTLLVNTLASVIGSRLRRRYGRF